MAGKIEDYALLGDCETGCAGQSPRVGRLVVLAVLRHACLAALLGRPENGRWLICPCDPGPGRRRRYRDGTLVLETDMETSEGAVTLVEFMPLREKTSDLVRLVVGKRGQARIRTELIRPQRSPTRRRFGATAAGASMGPRWMTGLVRDARRRRGLACAAAMCLMPAAGVMLRPRIDASPIVSQFDTWPYPPS
jgi:hypothetical protein